MHKKDTVILTGLVTIAINGEVVREIPNLVVTAGKTWLASRAGSASDAVMSHMAIGEGTTAVAVGDTTLETEIDRNALNVAGGTAAGTAITFECTWVADDPNVTAPAVTTITEAGIFNDGTAGDMLARVTFAAVSKGETDTMTISWIITVS